MPQTPGHGKTIAASYIVGVRGRPVDAVGPRDLRYLVAYQRNRPCCRSGCSRFYLAEFLSASKHILRLERESSSLQSDPGCLGRRCERWHRLAFARAESASLGKSMTPSILIRTAHAQDACYMYIRTTITVRHITIAMAGAWFIHTTLKH